MPYDIGMLESPSLMPRPYPLQGKRGLVNMDTIFGPLCHVVVNVVCMECNYPTSKLIATAIYAATRAVHIMLIFFAYYAIQKF